MRAAHAKVPFAALAATLAGLGGAGESRSQASLEGLTVKPEAKCLSPRPKPDRSIPPPVVESTYPTNGAVVRPGILIVRITFNVAMSCDGIFLKRPPMEKPCDNPQRQEYMLSYDRKTIRMRCEVSPNRRYGFRMNNDPAYDQLRPGIISNANFISLAGSALQPFELTFTTSSGPALTGVEAAEAEDKDAPANAPEMAVRSR
ncbi:MAG TPA: Ig-like domain-containing protein [Caulobacteraceae bacterium]|jgi:hypothetical protein|nr:Ig-like domain-containing protein [Caulobacteraceae bacterium]